MVATRTRFAAETGVPVERSRAEIERLLVRYGARSTAFMNSPDRALVMFEACNRKVLFELPLPRRDDTRFTQTASRGLRRTPDQALAAWEQGCRQAWRALRLVLHAKLEAIAAGITDFETEFLPHVVLPDGRTVAQHVKPRVAAIYTSGEMKPLLPAPGAAP